MPPRAKTIVLLSFACAVFLVPRRGSADTASDIRQFTGAPTRVVWIQDAGPTACVYSEKPTIRVMGFDTEDGKGERAILPDIGWYAKPQLTADGNRVIFHNLTDNTVNIVNFDGTGRRIVVKNAGEFEDDATWTDPKTGVVWVYAQIIEQRAGGPMPTIRRFQIDHPEVSELIWDKTPAHMFMLSGDGRAASGGVGNGGNTPQGVFTIPNGGFFERGGGCWPSMSPDGSHRSWVFTGNHRSIYFNIPTNRSGSANGYGVRFEAPGLEIKNNEEMYHPRWTNNIRYVCLDSPFSQWSWKSNEKIPMDVAAKVEIYIGKFKDDFKGIERWVQVTHNNVGDYWPNVWIKPTQAAQAALAAAPEAPLEKPSAPPDNRGLLYLWLTGADSNQLVDPSTGAIHQCSGQFKNDARLGSYGVMDLTGGAYVPDDATAGPLLAACKASNQFAAEAVLTPTGPVSDRESILVAFAGEPANGNFVLSEKGDTLLLRLKTDASAAPQPIQVCTLLRDRPNHIVVSYADGKLACYLNGKPLTISAAFHGGLSGWTAQPLIFGDTMKGGANWTGLMENIALFSREIPPAETHERYLRYRQRIAGRKPIPTALVEAKLIGRCPAADPQGIAPYRRCLSVQLYEVEKVVSGSCPDKKVSVAQWSVLDGKVVPDYQKLAVGQTCTLALERMDDHPEQQSERSISGDFDANDTQLYYEVRTPDAAPPADTEPPQSASSLAIGPGAPPVPEAVTITDPSESDLTSSGSARIAGHGTVAGATVQDCGVGYSEAPQVTFTGGGGQGAAGVAIMGVASLDCTSLGSGYTSSPVVTISPPDVAGGRQAAATARIDKAGGTLSGFFVSDSGTGYIRPPKVTLAGGGGADAEVEAVLALSGIVITNGGSGYTTPPAVTLDGDGQNARAQAALAMKTFLFAAGWGKSLFTNSGKLEQDAAAFIFDWGAGGNRQDHCGFSNTGSWSLKNGSRFLFASSSNRIAWVGSNSTNSGTLSVVDHSGLGFARLANSGELDLGAGAVLGQVEYGESENRLSNTGSLKIAGNTWDDPEIFGYAGSESSGQRIIDNGTKDGSSHAQVEIGTGHDQPSLTIVGGQVYVNNYPGSSIEVAPGAMLALITNDRGSIHPFNSRDAKVANGGNFLLAGELRVQGNHGGFTGIENSGVLTIHGDQAVVERLPNSTGPGGYYSEEETSTVILNQPGGVVEGIGKVAYVNSTNHPEGRFLKVSDLGTIAPGQPAVAGDPESYGPLVFANANVRIGAISHPVKVRPPATPAPLVASKPPRPGMLRIGIGGPPTAPDRYDSLVVTGTGDYGRVAIVRGGDTLNIVPGPGYTPHGTYRIITAAAVEGGFDILQYNGSAQAPYTVQYLPDGVEAVFP